MKLLTPALVLLLGAVVAATYAYRQHQTDRTQYQQIHSAALHQDFSALDRLSAASSSELQRAYIQYRRALSAETRRDYPLMRSALDASEAALGRVASQEQKADVHALQAAIHLRRMLHSDQSDEHRKQLDQALTRAHQQDPNNPGMLLVAAMSTRYSAEPNGQEDALYDLMLHEAGVQFARRCDICASAEQTYIWQGIARSMERETGVSGPWLIARASCMDDPAQSLLRTGS